MKSESIQFDYWLTVMDMEGILLILAKSIHSFNFQMLVGALEQITLWMITLDHTNYAS